MNVVHVFSTIGRFSSFEELQNFIDSTYSEDGDGIPSRFMEEVGLKCYEPMCIEAYHSETTQLLRDLLCGSSYGEQWLSRIEENEMANSAICVFPPNTVSQPATASLKYVGAFVFEPANAQQSVQPDRREDAAPGEQHVRRLRRVNLCV